MPPSSMVRLLRGPPKSTFSRPRSSKLVAGTDGPHERRSRPDERRHLVVPSQRRERLGVRPFGHVTAAVHHAEKAEWLLARRLKLVPGEWGHADKVVSACVEDPVADQHPRSAPD